jgi:exosortase
LNTLATITRAIHLDWIITARFQSVLIVSSFGYLYYRVFLGLVNDWWSNSAYSHGVLIPFLSGYLIWQRRKELSDAHKQPSYIGFGIFLLGLISFIVGTVGGEEIIQRLSLPLSLLGLVFYLGGSQVVRLCLFPVAYLVMMIPLPFPIYRLASLRLRLFDSRVAEAVLPFLGVPVYREGYFLFLPNVVLEVADACSGVLSIVALMAIGVFYVHQVRSQRRLLLWLAIVPIAVAANAIRIVLVSAMSHHLGDWVLGTTFHRLTGTFNFLLGFLVLVMMHQALERILPKKNCLR